MLRSQILNWCSFFFFFRFLKSVRKSSAIVSLWDSCLIPTSSYSDSSTCSVVPCKFELSKGQILASSARTLLKGFTLIQLYEPCSWIPVNSTSVHGKSQENYSLRTAYIQLCLVSSAHQKGHHLKRREKPDVNRCSEKSRASSHDCWFHRGNRDNSSSGRRQT